ATGFTSKERWSSSCRQSRSRKASPASNGPPTIRTARPSTPSLRLPSCRGGRVNTGCAYARVPVNGKLPMKPMPISPEMASPATLPVNSSVSGIGLVMETFQATSSPLTVPSKISAELPSAPWVPVSVPPEFFRLSVALRSPIGVLMVIFQFPSTAIQLSSRVYFAKPEWFWDRAGGGIAHPAGQAQYLERPRRSGPRGADPAGDQNPERDILHGEGGYLGCDRDHRHI